MLFKFTYNEASLQKKFKEPKDKGAREFKKLTSFLICFANGFGQQRAPLFINNKNLFNMLSKKEKSNAIRVKKSATIQLPVSNKHGIPVLEDFLSEIQRRFDVEKNIKNNLYAFIMERGLFDELRDYSSKHDMSSPDGHSRAVECVIFNVLSEFKN